MGRPIFPLEVHQPASPFIFNSSVTPATPVQKSRGNNEIMSMWVLQSNSGDGYDLASTLCKHDLRKGDLFVLSWAGCDE